jgi:hypothetical protein
MPVASALTLLTHARTLLEQGWCQGRYACDAEGNPVGILSKNAASWCLHGALFRAQVDLGLVPPTDAVFEARKAVSAEALVRLPVLRGTPHMAAMEYSETPGRTIAEVLDLVNAARARVGGQAPPAAPAAPQPGLPGLEGC